MSPVWIRTRTTGGGDKRYHVVYRRGGRAYRQEFAGSFKTLKEAKIRRDLVGGWLAAGLHPGDELLKVTASPRRPKLEDTFDAFIISRIDVTEKTLALYRNARERVVTVLGTRPPDSLTPTDIQDWIGQCGDLAPATVRQYLGTLRQVLDYADVEPNPARSKKVRLPASVLEEVQAPSSREWAAIRTRISSRYLLVLRLIECEGLRLNEALGLTYGDIDFNMGRLRVSRARTKGRTAGQRWLPVPIELLDEIGDLVPLEDRHRDRRVFPGLTDSGVRSAFGVACKFAETAHYSPHELRHRRVSLWFAHGFDPVQVKTWAGHAKASMSLNVYAHVTAEPHLDEWQQFWVDSYQAQRRVRGGVFGLNTGVDSGPEGEAR